MWPRLNVISACHLPGRRARARPVPELRFGFVETGASWIPYVDQGARACAARRRSAGYDFKTEIPAHNRFYVTCDTEDDIADLLNYGAEDYLMIGTDYSHVDQSAELRAHQVIVEHGRGGEFSPAVADEDRERQRTALLRSLASAGGDGTVKGEGPGG